MKRILMAASIIFFCNFISGCAHSAPVTLVWTNPRFNAIQGSCASSADTLKDLGSVDIYAQRSGRTDSILVFSSIATSREAKVDSTVVDQPEGITTYWIYALDILNNRSCKSATTTKQVILTPTAPVFK